MVEPSPLHISVYSDILYRRNRIWTPNILMLGAVLNRPEVKSNSAPRATVRVGGILALSNPTLCEMRH